MELIHYLHADVMLSWCQQIQTNRETVAAVQQMDSRKVPTVNVDVCVLIIVDDGW